MDAREAKIDKVRKLLALALGAGASEAEAASAASAAQRIMMEFDIAEAEIEAANEADAVAARPEAIGVDVIATLGGQVLEAEWMLLFAVTRDTGRLGPYKSVTRDAAGAKRMVLHAYGPISEIETARLTYAYLRDQVRRITKVAYDERGGPGLAWKYSFELGCAQRVRSRLMAQRRELTVDVRRLASPGALAIVDQRAKAITVGLTAKAKDLRLRSGGRGSSRAGGDADGYAAGRRAGDGVDLTTPKRATRLGGGS